MIKFFLTLRSNLPTHKGLIFSSGVTHHQSNPFLCLTALIIPKVSFHICQFQGLAVLGSSICLSQDFSEPRPYPLPCPIWKFQWWGEEGTHKVSSGPAACKRRRGPPSGSGKMSPGLNTPDPVFAWCVLLLSEDGRERIDRHPFYRVDTGKYLTWWPGTQ